MPKICAFKIFAPEPIEIQPSDGWAAEGEKRKNAGIFLRFDLVVVGRVTPFHSHLSSVFFYFQFFFQQTTRLRFGCPLQVLCFLFNSCFSHLHVINN